MKTLDEILRKLADERWRKLRREHNRAWSCYGPGTQWDAYKINHADEYAEIVLLRTFLNLDPES